MWIVETTLTSTSGGYPTRKFYGPFIEEHDADAFVVPITAGPDEVITSQRWPLIQP